MLTINVEEAAQIFGVTPKTIRSWIRDDGMPVVAEGQKGTGTSARLSLMAAMDWWRRKKTPASATMAEFFKEKPFFGPNPLRELLRIYAAGVPAMLKAGLIAWLNEVRGGQKQTDWQGIGLTEAQSRRVVGDVFQWVFTLLIAYQENFEANRLQPLTQGGGLDDLASLWFGGEFQSTWGDLIDIPPEMLEFLPASARAAYENLRAPVEDPPKEKTR